MFYFMCLVISIKIFCVKIIYVCCNNLISDLFFLIISKYLNFMVIVLDIWLFKVLYLWNGFM